MATLGHSPEHELAAPELAEPQVVGESAPAAVAATPDVILRAAEERRRRLPGRRWARRLFALSLLAAVVGAACDGFIRANGPHKRFQRALFALANDDVERAQAELFHLKDLPDYQPHAALISGVLLLQERKLAAALDE
ncbi:MAG TPA: hypothetical protein VGX76_03855, partial [Pirellulales bacterium]|nr:hypothetical protein [Pirellulales bacterium]